MSFNSLKHFALLLFCAPMALSTVYAQDIDQVNCQDHKLEPKLKSEKLLSQSLEIQSLRAKLNCPHGMLKEVELKLSDLSSQGTMIYGDLESGSHEGEIQEVYAGMTPNYALLVVTKVSDGESINYNATLSLCKIVNSMSGKPILDDKTQLKNLSLSSALVLSKSTRCQTGSIDAGQFGFDSGSIGWLPYSLSPVCK